MEVEEWAARYEEVMRNPPPLDYILTTIDGSPIKLTVVLKEGDPPFIFGRVYVPQTVGCELGWFAQGEEDHQLAGWKCVLLSKARTQIVERFGLGRKEIYVKSLRLVKYSSSKNSMLCEVACW